MLLVTRLQKQASTCTVGRPECTCPKLASGAAQPPIQDFLMFARMAKSPDPGAVLNRMWFARPYSLTERAVGLFEVLPFAYADSTKHSWARTPSNCRHRGAKFAETWHTCFLQPTELFVSFRPLRLMRRCIRTEQEFLVILKAR